MIWPISPKWEGHSPNLSDQGRFLVEKLEDYLIWIVLES